MTTTTTPQLAARRRCDSAVRAARAGSMDLASAHAIIAALASALDVTLYDAAIDAIDELADGTGIDIDSQSAPKVLRAQAQARYAARIAAHGDSDTRRARHRANTYSPATSSGIGRGALGTPGNDTRHVTAARPWRTRQPARPITIDYYQGPCPADGDWGAWRPVAIERRAEAAANAEAADAAARAKAYRNQAGDGPVKAIVGYHQHDEARYDLGLGITILQSDLDAIGQDAGVICPECHMVGMCDC